MTAGTPNRRAPLLGGCAIALAMAALAHAAPAAAQIDPNKSFQGIGTSTGATIEQNGINDVITVTAPQAIIDWAPIDTGPGPIVFLPGGRTATFQNDSSISDYVVLNRIVPTDTTRGIRFDGTVRSQITDITTGATTTGGSVWFYSPGGIIAGSSALFDVGNLVLTSNPIDTSGGLFGPGGEIRFGQAINPGATVDLNFGSRINALTPGSYVAIVAPRIAQAGTVNVDGSTAYVGAEAATIRINGGLFDIAISTGTTGTAIDHRGTTTGPANSAGTSRIYMTTIAKNDAVSMLVSGTIGYTPASSAFVDNGTVVLAAGYDITGGVIDAAPAAGNSGPADIAIGSPTSFGATFSSDITARAGNALTATIGDGGVLNFTSDADLHGDSSATITVPGFGQRVQVGGNLTLSSGRGGQGGIATLETTVESGYGAAPGTIDVTGDLIVDAGTIGAINFTPGGAGGNATGGTADIDIQGGSLSVGGSMRVLATATGGYGPGRSGNGTGGTARVSLGAGSTVNVGSLSIDVSGSSNDFDSQAPGRTVIGGNGTGGTLAELNIAGGDFTTFSVDINANGAGGSGGGVSGDDPGGAGGNGRGGNARLTMTGGSASIGNVSLNAGGFGGTGGLGGPGGNGSGGTAALSVTGTSLTVDGGTFLNASGDGDYGTIGGDATGGQTSITVGIGGAFMGSGFTALDASAFAGGGQSAGGQAVGGLATISADGGSILLGDFDVRATARANSADILGGAATGGDIMLTARDGGSITSTASFAGLSADASGGSADSGGNGTGGKITLEAAGGSISFDPQSFLALNAGGSGGRSFVSNPTTGQGGTIAIISRAGASGTSALAFGDFIASTDGSVGGGADFFRGGVAGTGGLGLGGTVTTTLSSGTLDAAIYSLSATGTGGQSTPGGVAGDGEGGFVTFDQTGGTATIGTLEVSAIGIGGDGAFGDSDFAATAGGTGFGGDATVRVRSIDGTATLSVGSLTVDAAGIGGEGGFAFQGDGGSGGIGRGGIAQFTTEDGAIVTGSQLRVTAQGQGGSGSGIFYDFTDLGNDNGGSGGAGFGGDAQTSLIGSGVQFGAVVSDAIGTGGDGGSVEYGYGAFDPLSTGRGGDAGAGTGGTASVLIAGGSTPSAVTVQASGQAGDAGTGPFGGNGGAGAGGSATLTVQDSTATLINPTVLASGLGSSGAAALVHDGGNGGSGTGGTARIVADGASTALTLNGYSINANGSGGQGGAGGFGTTGGLGGNGGSATGGTAELQAQLGMMTLISGEGGLNSLFALGLGGAGGAGGGGLSGGAGGNGGDGTGGTARASAVGGSLNAADFFAIADGQAGSGGAGGLDSGGASAAAGTEGFGAGGAAALQLQDGPSGQLGAIRFANTTLQAGGRDGNGATAGRAGRVSIDDSGADPAGSIRLTSLTAFAQGLTTDANSGFALSSSAGPVVVVQDMLVRTNGPVAIAAQGSGGLQVGGALSLFGDQSITISHSGQPASGSPFDTVHAASLMAQTDGIFLASPGSVIRTSGAIALNAGGDINGTDALLAAGTTFDAIAGGGLTFSRISAGDRATLHADNGAVRVTGDLVAANGVDAFGLIIDLTAVGPLTVNQAQTTSGDIRLTSQDGDLTLGVVDARGGVFATAGGTLAVQSSVAGTTIALDSADVDIGSNAQVGQYDRTTAVTFTNSGTATSYIGGSGTGSAPGYRLSDAELQQVTTNGELLIRSPNDVVLDTLSLMASNNFGPDGRFTIDTSGDIDIIGAAVFSRLGDDATVALNAEGDIRLAAETGSVALDDGDGGLAGVLELNAGSIVAASSAAQADIAGAATMAAIDSRLGTNDGSPDDDGYFRANTIRATVSHAFYVQNSGANSSSRDDRRGITVGTGGLEIASTSSAPIRVVVNGRQREDDGSFTTGVPFLQKVRFARATVFDAGSTANGCRFSKAPDCDAPDVPEIIPEIDAVRDVIDSLIEGEDQTEAPNGGSVFPSTLIQIVDFTPTSIEPVVDEPVTGSGNEDLWLGEGAKPQGN